MINSIAVTSLKGSASGAIWDAGIRLLFTYIADRGCVLSLDIVGSISVHAWCIGDDCVYDDQYCSYSINIL